VIAPPPGERESAGVRAALALLALSLGGCVNGLPGSEDSPIGGWVVGGVVTLCVLLGALANRADEADRRNMDEAQKQIDDAYRRLLDRAGTPESAKRVPRCPFCGRARGASFSCAGCGA
jgi:hypothetical protein